MTAEKFASSAGCVTISYDEKSATAQIFMRFRAWGASYEERCVSSTADAIQRVIKRLEYEPDGVKITERLRVRLDDMKQGDLFARER